MLGYGESLSGLLIRAHLLSILCLDLLVLSQLFLFFALFLGLFRNLFRSLWIVFSEEQLESFQDGF